MWDARGGLKPAYRLEGYTYFPVRAAAPWLVFIAPPHAFLLGRRQLDMDISDDGNYLITSTKGFNSVGCDLWVRK